MARDPGSTYGHLKPPEVALSRHRQSSSTKRPGTLKPGSFGQCIVTPWIIARKTPSQHRPVGFLARDRPPPRHSASSPVDRAGYPHRPTESVCSPSQALLCWWWPRPQSPGHRRGEGRKYDCTHPVMTLSHPVLPAIARRCFAAVQATEILRMRWTASRLLGPS